MNVNDRSRRTGMGLVASSISARQAAQDSIQHGRDRRVATHMRTVLESTGVTPGASARITRQWTIAVGQQRRATAELRELLTARSEISTAETRLRAELEAARQASANERTGPSVEQASATVEDLELALDDKLADASGTQELIDEAREKLTAARQVASKIERQVLQQPASG